MIPSIFFTVDIAHSHDLALRFRDQGVKVYPLSGKTPTEERRRLIRLFKAGGIDGLASCGVLQEGFDSPIAMGGFMCRPTMSGLLYRQMAGRVLRPWPAVEGARDYQDTCEHEVLRLAKAGIIDQLIVMATGCHAKGQEILMYDGSIKSVESVQVGDQLMGPDGNPRNVLSLCRGLDQMKTIVPNKGASFTVNQKHVMTLVRTKKRKAKSPSCQGGAIIDIPLNEYSEKSKTFRHMHKLLSVGVDFPLRPMAPVAPYIMGLLLGDGSLHEAGTIGLCCNDPEPLREFFQYCRTSGLHIRPDGDGTSVTYFVSGENRENHLLESIKELGLWKHGSGDKFIPHCYKTGSRGERLELLAGLIDTDGSYDGGCYDFVSKSQQLSLDVAFVARSLGLAAYVKPCEKGCQTGASGTYFRVCISGNINSVPCRIARKKAAARRQKKDPMRRGFRVVDAGFGEYFGFTLDGDGRYLMGDFTVTHNTGKTVVSAKFTRMIEQWKSALRMPHRGRILFLVHRDELATQAADTFQFFNPHLKVGIEKAQSYAPAGANIVVASVQTLGPPGKDGGPNERLKQFPPGTFDMVEIDEAHHAAKGKYYHAILKHLKCMKDIDGRDPGCLHVGVTATPGRSDNAGLENLYSEIAYNYDIRTAIDDGWLVKPHVYRAETTVDLSKIDRTAGDFSLSQLENAVNTPQRNQIVVDKYLEVCKLEGMDGPIGDIQHWTKPHAILVDFVDISGRHALVTAPTLFGLPKTYDAKGKDVVGQAKAIEALEDANPGLDLRSDECKDMDAVKATLRKIDILSPMATTTPLEVQRYSQMPWVKDSRGGYYLSLPGGTALSARQNGLGCYEVSRHNKGVRQPLHVARDLCEALSVADKSIPERDQLVMRSDAAWKKGAPTEPQARLLWMLDRKLKKEFPTPQSLFEAMSAQFKAGDQRFSKGAVSERINQAKANRS